MTFLIADDNDVNRKLVRASLQKMGHDLVEAVNGTQALEAIFKASGPMVGLIDWEMPGMEGIEVCRQARLRQDSPPLYLILLTVRDKRADVLSGLENGANDYITKPFDRGEFLARVKIGMQTVELQQTLVNKVAELREALGQVKQLSGLLPICAYCKSIRDGKDYWHKVESYISQHSTAQFSHGICPACIELHITPQLKALEEELQRENANPSPKAV